MFPVLLSEAFSQTDTALLEYYGIEPPRTQSFFPKTHGFISGVFTQTLNAEGVREGSERYHPRTLSLYGSYAFGKSNTLGIFVDGAYRKGTEKGYFFVAGGPQFRFDFQGELVGETKGSVLGSAQISTGVGVWSGATGKERLLGYVKVLGLSKGFELNAEFWGAENIFGFYGRATGNVLKFLRVGISGEKYPETTASLGPLVEGIAAFDRKTSLSVGGTLGAQVQSGMRFHWQFGFHANISLHF